MNNKQEGILGSIVRKIISSPKFLQYISSLDLTTLISDMATIPGIKDRLKKIFGDFGRDLRERYEIKDYSWFTEEDKAIVCLLIDTSEVRQDFIDHFYNFLRQTRSEYGGGFDVVIKHCEIKSISCSEDNNSNSCRIEVTSDKISEVTNIFDLLFGE